MSSRRDQTMQYRTEVDGPDCAIWLSGELDLSSAGRLETAIAELCADGARRIVLEMGELSFMDSTGLRSVLVGDELCRAGGCELLIGGTSRQVERLFQVSGVGKRVQRRADADADAERA